MSRTIHASLQAKLTAGTSNLCHIITITRVDGTIKRFTDLDVDLVVGAFTYESSDSFALSAITSSSNNGIQSTTCNIIFSETGFIDTEVAQGLYDFAHVEFATVDYTNTTWGKQILLTGHMSSINVTNRKSGQFEVSGLLSRGDVRLGEYYSAECRANLGDARCTIDTSTFEATGSVIDAEGYLHKFVGNVAGDHEDHIFDGGVLVWDTGLNTGIAVEVQDYVFLAADFIYLVMRMPNEIQAGDTFTLTTGCDKRPITCRDKFDNIVNFRGEPFVPGSNYINDIKII